jgi:hypothetical protein
MMRAILILFEERICGILKTIGVPLKYMNE